MRYYHLDGRRMTDKAAAHRYLKRKLNLPAYYGGNLDALHDVLGDMSAENREMTVILHRPDAALRRLGDYGETLMAVFADSAEEGGWRFIQAEK